MELCCRYFQNFNAQESDELMAKSFQGFSESGRFRAVGSFGRIIPVLQPLSTLSTYYNLYRRRKDGLYSDKYTELFFPHDSSYVDVFFVLVLPWLSPLLLPFCSALRRNLIQNKETLNMLILFVWQLIHSLRRMMSTECSRSYNCSSGSSRPMYDGSTDFCDT